MGAFIDITGQRFGRLVAIQSLGLNARGKRIWLCQCDCGKEKTIRSDHLLSGDTQSCGCKKGETQAEITRFNSKWIAGKNGCHIWQAAKDRHGYGQFWLRRRQWRAHQVALLLAGRAIPEGFVVNHICRNKSCVNPQHIEAIPTNDNWRKDSNAVTYVNSRKTHCPRGHPLDRKYGRSRYCSICERAKKKRLRAKWKAEGIFKL